ncbi:MAG: EamA/RhaT family transporter [Anaerolineae bacterium]|jgi:drug/metabolite transporter (DMT)-like permease|nr:MAG: EamA/RhaT family transporter [Anaerolineae bacterium]
MEKSVLLPAPDPSRLAKGYLICVAATISWAFTGIFIRYLTVNYQLSPLTLSFWRDVFVVLGLVMIFSVGNRALLPPGKGRLPYFALYGVVVALFNGLWSFSVALNGAAAATVLAYSSAAFTALLAWRLFREPLTPIKVLAVSLGLGGCVLVAGAYDAAAWALNPFGILTGLCSGLIFAVYSLMGKFTANRGINSWTALLYSFAFAALYFLPLSLLGGWLQGVSPLQSLFWLGNRPLGWLVLFVLGVGPTVGGFGFYSLSLNYLQASIANLIAMMEPLITAVLAYLLLGERLTPPQLLGGGMILGSVLILRLFEMRSGNR